MVTQNQVPAAIEGSQLLVVGQDIRPSGIPRRLPKNDEIVYPLTVKMRGESIIEEENIPKQVRFKDYSMLDVGDKISGTNMWGFTSEFLGPNDIKVGGRGRTGKHTGQELAITGTCFMELIEGWLGLAIATHPKQELLQAT